MIFLNCEFKIEILQQVAIYLNTKLYSEQKKFEFPVYGKTSSNGHFDLLENLMKMESDEVYLNVGSGQGDKTYKALFERVERV